MNATWTPDDIPCWVCSINPARKVRIVSGKGYDLCPTHTKWFDEIDRKIKRLVKRKAR